MRVRPHKSGPVRRHLVFFFLLFPHNRKRAVETPFRANGVRNLPFGHLLPRQELAGMDRTLVYLIYDLLIWFLLPFSYFQEGSFAIPNPYSLVGIKS